MPGAVTRVSGLTSAGGEVAPADRRRWLQGFAEVSSQHGAMMRVWTDAGRTDDLLQSSGPGAFDWGRRQMAASLASRAYGDVDADAVVMLAMVEGFGSRPRSEAELDEIGRASCRERECQYV